MSEPRSSEGVNSEPVRPGDGWVLAIARDRDREAFVALYEHYAPRLKTYLARMGGADNAEELAQEAMLSVWNKAHAFDPAKASASTWIFTIARNLFIDRVRKERRPEVDPSDPLMSGETPPGAEKVLALRQSENAVKRALEALPKDQARVVEMSFFEDKPHTAIATELNIPLGTVKSRLRLAFMRLRGQLDDLR